MPSVLSRSIAHAGHRLVLGRTDTGLIRVANVALGHLGPSRWLRCGAACTGLTFNSRGRVTVSGLGQPTWRQRQQQEDSNRHIWWLTTAIVGIFGAVFAMVPLYKMYCQSTGQGQAVQSHKEYAPPPDEGTEASKRLISVDFTCTVHSALPWEFSPQQRRVVVGLGETALAFYRAKNTSDRPIIGVSVYHMLPPEVGLYFNKVQCFCFDEQLINPQEEVDLPIFFFIDPMMGKDSRFDHIEQVTLSYLFFESDSEIPEGYEDFKTAVPSSQRPSALDAPAPTAPTTAVAA